MEAGNGSLVGKRIREDMDRLTEDEKQDISRIIAAGEPLPAKWQSRLFPQGLRPNGPTDVPKEYRLVYAGKMKREEVLTQTPAAPWQLVRRFCTERPHTGGWRNLLVWGDNLLAMRELLVDQQGSDRFGTRGKIKLVYIDPPFATRQDFMKDKEKAYRDKVLGAQFIEFLRRRLIVLRELLSSDGSIYIHLDVKKGHYIKAVMDEVLGEENFRNEIIWKRSAAHSDSSAFANIHDSLLFYSKSDVRRFTPQYSEYDPRYAAQRYKHRDPDGRRFMDDNLTAMGLRGGGYTYEWKGITREWRCPRTTMERYERENRLYYTRSGGVRLKRYLDEMEGRAVQDVWTDIFPVNSQAEERQDYPTQKPETLLARILEASSRPGDIVMDCFAGGGTLPAVAEKLGRRWIAMDCGKLSIYTMQRRLFALSTTVGSTKKDDRVGTDRIDDWDLHLRTSSGALVLPESSGRKAQTPRVNVKLLKGLALLATSQGLFGKTRSLSLVCQSTDLDIPKTLLRDTDEPPGSLQVTIDDVIFRISVIPSKAPVVESKPLQPREFALYRSGVYDLAAIKALPWEEYRPLVLKLFGIREHPHKRYGLPLDGYFGTHSAKIWNYPEHKALTLDYGYVDDLHSTLRGKPGERFYIIAPVVSMAFAEDEVTRNGTAYVFLKVPLSVLLRLVERSEPAALRQPAKEADVNEVIDAVGFDFISQPQVQWTARKVRAKGELFPDFVLEVSEFRAQTLATDPEDFKNLETFSMAMVDLDYNGDVFRLSRVFWGEDLLKAAGGLDEAECLTLRIPVPEFTGRQMMVILCDRYGNEKALLLRKEDFGHASARPRRSTARNRRST